MAGIKAEEIGNFSSRAFFPNRNAPPKKRQRQQRKTPKPGSNPPRRFRFSIFLSHDTKLLISGWVPAGPQSHKIPHHPQPWALPGSHRHSPGKNSPCSLPVLHILQVLLPSRLYYLALKPGLTTPSISLRSARISRFQSALDLFLSSLCATI